MGCGIMRRPMVGSGENPPYRSATRSFLIPSWLTESDLPLCNDKKSGYLRKHFVGQRQFFSPWLLPLLFVDAKAWAWNSEAVQGPECCCVGGHESFFVYCDAASLPICLRILWNYSC